MGVGAGLYMCDVVKNFTFAISFPDEFLFYYRYVYRCGQLGIEATSLHPECRYDTIRYDTIQSSFGPGRLLIIKNKKNYLVYLNVV